MLSYLPMTNRKEIDMDKPDCSVKDCDRVVRSIGMCNMHSQRFWKNGHTDENPKCRVHGLSKTLAHKSWECMNYRCYGVNALRYSDWGGRGIRVCDEWRDNFPQFLKDMGPRIDKSYSLERRDNDGNYEPSNCYWATKRQQNTNQRMQKNNTSGVIGVCWNKAAEKWTAAIKLEGGKQKHLISTDSFEEAVKARKEAERIHYGKHVE